MLAALRHPNVCLFMGACVVPPNRAIVTELVSRGSLWEALRDGNLPSVSCGCHTIKYYTIILFLTLAVLSRHIAIICPGYHIKVNFVFDFMFSFSTRICHRTLAAEDSRHVKAAPTDTISQVHRTAGRGQWCSRLPRA